LDAGSPFEGRVLAGALRDGAPEAPAWQSHDEVVAFAARGREWIQRVSFERIGNTAYVARGAVQLA
jgi:hypothetical protein